MKCCSDVMEPIKSESCCTPQDSVVRAAQVMRDTGCGCAPVVDTVKTRQLVGVVTERDVCCGVVADDRRASEVRVADVMKPASASCGADEPLDAAHQKLADHRTTSLPVVDSAGNCCGTVNLHHLGRK